LGEHDADPIPRANPERAKRVRQASRRVGEFAEGDRSRQAPSVGDEDRWCIARLPVREVRTEVVSGWQIPAKRRRKLLEISGGVVKRD
jgi:hypothetical protein